MINEVYDRQSGAILFKKDADSLRTEEFMRYVKELTGKIEKLEEKVSELEKLLNK